MDSDSYLQQLLRKASAVIRSRWTSRVLFFSVLVTFVQRSRSDQIELSTPDLSMVRLSIAVMANIVLLGLFSISWTLVVQAVAGVKVSFVPFALSQPLKLIPGGVAQPIYLAKQYHGVLSGKNILVSFAVHALFGVVVPGGFLLGVFFSVMIMMGQGAAILMAAVSIVMLSPLFVLLAGSCFRNQIAIKFPESNISRRAVIRVVGTGILGLTCHGISFWALSSDLAFEHVLLFGGSLGFGVLLLPFPAGFGPREWFFVKFMGGVITSSVLVAFVAHRLLQMISEFFVALVIQQNRFFTRLRRGS